MEFVGQIVLFVLTIALALNKINLTNALYGVAIILAVVYVCRYGFSVAQCMKSFDKKFLVLVLATVCVFLITAIFGYDSNNALRYCRKYAEWMLFGLLSSISISLYTRNIMNTLTNAIVVCGVANSLVVFYEYIVLHIARAGMMFLGHPNNAGALFIFSLPFVFQLKANRYLKSLLCGIFVLALLLTGSKGALLGLISVGIAFVVTNGEYIRKCWKMHYATVVAVIIMILGVAVFQGDRQESMLARLTYIAKNMDDISGKRVGYDRVFLWQSAVKMITDYPLTGVGLNNFNKVYIGEHYILPEAKEPYLESPHNIFLMSAVETGLPGLGVFVLLLTYQLVSLKKRAKSNKMFYPLFLALIGVIVHGMVDWVYWNWWFYKFYWFVASMVWCSMMLENYTKQNTDNRSLDNNCIK